jgi:hypothetical protein
MMIDGKKDGGSGRADARKWHSMRAGEVLAALGVDDSGLKADQVAERLEEYGPNLLPDPATRGPFPAFLRQFNNILIFILLAAAVFTAVLEEWIDVGVIFSVVLINAVIGFIQEGKAERAMEAIRGMLSPSATVLRDGEEQELPARDLVPGDIVLLKSGDRVPADMRVSPPETPRSRRPRSRASPNRWSKESEPVGGTPFWATARAWCIRHDGHCRPVARRGRGHRRRGGDRPDQRDGLPGGDPEHAAAAQDGRVRQNPVHAAIVSSRPWSSPWATSSADFRPRRCSWPSSAWPWPLSPKGCRRS